MPIKPMTRCLFWAPLLAGLLPAASLAAPTLGGCPVFPDNAVFNTRIDDTSRYPRHPMSDTWVASVGATRALHLDWGRNDNAQQWQDYYGIPYNIVDGTPATTGWPSVRFDASDPRAGNGDGVPDESDCAAPDNGGYRLVRNCETLTAATRRFPFPNAGILKAEHGSCNDAQQCGDRHVLVVEQGTCRLWESYFSYLVDNQWYAYSTAAWDLKSNAMRPDTWTSGDAAGLPILPLLARVDEAEAGLIAHAFRVTFQDSVIDRSYVWPARHRAGGATANGMPFGALLRLKADTVIPANWTTEARAVATAMKQYGLYVADIGSNLYVQGEPSARWDEATWSQLQSLRMQQFEFVDLGVVENRAGFDPDSFAVPDDSDPLAPGAATLASLPAEAELVGGAVDVSVAWQGADGVPADSWQLLVNGVSVHQAALASSGGVQSGSHTYHATQAGWLAFVVRLCAGDHCTDSPASSVHAVRPRPVPATLAPLADSYSHAAGAGVTVPVAWTSSEGNGATLAELSVNGTVVQQQTLSTASGAVSGHFDHVASQDGTLNITVLLCNERCAESAVASTKITVTGATPGSGGDSGGGGGGGSTALTLLAMLCGMRLARARRT